MPDYNYTAKMSWQQLDYSWCLITTAQQYWQW